jgi:hypothetical protein
VRFKAIGLLQSTRVSPAITRLNLTKTKQVNIGDGSNGIESRITMDFENWKTGDETATTMVKEGDLLRQRYDNAETPDRIAKPVHNNFVKSVST